MIYSQPPKLPYTLVFIPSICHHISQAISHFPCPVGCLRLLWVDFQALRLSSSYILFDSLESTQTHPFHHSLNLTGVSHPAKFHFNSLWFSKRQAIVLCPVVPLSTCFDVTLALAHSVSGSLSFLPSLPLASHFAFLRLSASPLAAIFGRITCCLVLQHGKSPRSNLADRRLGGAFALLAFGLSQYW